MFYEKPTAAKSSTTQTVTEQLFGGKSLWLWLGLLTVLIIVLIGTFWDLADANLLGTGQGLDAGSAGLMIAASVAVALFFLSNVLFGTDMRAKRGLAPAVSGKTGTVVFWLFIVALVAGVVYFLTR